MKEIKLKKGIIKIDNNLTILDGIRKNKRSIRIILIVAILSTFLNGYKLYLHFSKTLAILTIAIIILGLVTAYLLYTLSNEIKIFFDEINKVSIKKIWKNQKIVRLDLTDGKHRFISHFKNTEDVETFYQIINDKINLKS